MASAKGKHFILEGDEYDTAFFDKGPKFLHYFPDSVILTSVEFDHADIYKDLDAVETAFKRLVNLVPRRGRIVAFDSGESAGASIDRCLQKAFCPVERYGVPERAEWRINKSEAGRRPNFLVGACAMANPGPISTSRSAANTTSGMRPPPPRWPRITESRKTRLRRLSQTFRSVKRRLEVKAEVNGITIIDDFAHHPTAIEQTIHALRARYPQSRLWVVLEPRSNTMRRNVLQDALARSLALADEVVIAAIFKSEAIPEAERLDLNRVIDEIQKRGKPARILADADAIVERDRSRTAPARRGCHSLQWRIRRHL